MDHTVAPYVVTFATGFGAYRTLRYGKGSQRWLGLVPIFLFLVVPALAVVISVYTWVPNEPAMGQFAQDLLFCSEVLGAILGLVLGLRFVPPKKG